MPQNNDQAVQETALRRPRKSLKWKMFALVLGCWVMPYVLLVVLMGNYMRHSTEVQTEETILQSVELGVNITMSRLSAIADASIKASYLNTLKTAWQKYENDGNSVRLYDTVTKFLSQQYKYDENIMNAILLRTDANNQYYYSTNLTYNASVTGVRKFVQNLGGEVLEMSKTIGTEMAFLARDGYCFLIRNLMDSNYEPYAVLVLELNNDAVFDSMYEITWATDVTVWLGDVALGVRGQTLEAPGKFPTSGVSEYSLEGVRYNVTGAAESGRVSMNYRICGNATPMETQLASQHYLILGALLLLGVLLGSILLFFYHEINRPVVALMRASKEIERGNFGFQVQRNAMASQEFFYLSDSFNSMSDTLQNQFERIYKEELALRDAKIMALQSQINPHFLNNTLEIINWEARIAGNVSVCQMLESLSTMLSAAMDRKKRPLIHLAEELMYVDAYLHIIRERLGRRLTVEKEISPDVMDCYVPRLVLQPVLENAVEHGITPMQKGTIIIRAYREGDHLYLEVENDGVTTYEDLMRIQTLLSDEPPADGTGSTSLGIRNVHQRLRIIYGESCGLSITLTNQGNTLCRMVIDWEKSVGGES